MRTYLFIVTLIATLSSSVDVRAQGAGVINYSTVGAPFEKRIFLIYTGRPEDSILLEGNGYQTALYWGAPGTTDDRNLVQIGGAVGFLTGTSAGTFFGGGRTINGIQNGSIVSLQSRSWAVVSGVANSYEAVLASGMGPAGKGPVFDFKLKDPTNPLETTPNIWQAPGWRGYMIGIPEPSTIAIALLGAGTFLMLRRRT